MQAMTHPYAPWIITALAVVILTGITLIAYAVRADRRDTRRLAWDKAQADWERQQRQQAALREDLAYLDLLHTEPQ
jgi:hypothetical protein